MSSAEADGWAWLLVLSFVFGCNVLRILLPSFSSFVSGTRGAPTGRATAGFRPQKRLGWAVLGFKKEMPGHPRPRFHVAASLRLGVLSGPPPPALIHVPYFLVLAGTEQPSAAAGTVPGAARRPGFAGGLGLPRTGWPLCQVPETDLGAGAADLAGGMGCGGVVDSVDRESQRCVLFPVSRGAAGPGERCPRGAFCQGTSTLPPGPLSQLL